MKETVAPNARPSLDAICESLHTEMAKKPGVALWLAVDGGFQDLPDTLSALQDKAVPDRFSVTLLHPDIPRHWQPTWYALHLERPSDSDLLRASVELALAELQSDTLRAGDGRRIAGWLQIAGSVGEVAARIGRAMVQMHPDGHGSLLRWHDPAVLWALWPLLDSTQQATWLGSVQCWYLLDPLGCLAALHADKDSNTDVVSEVGVHAFSAHQWTNIGHIKAFNHGLRQYLSQPEVGRPDLAQLHQVCMAALRRARALNFHDPGDLAVFAEHALCVHPYFDIHPLVQAVLKERDTDAYYSGVVAQLSVTDWQVVHAS
ncbi:MAG: DUF4123 domain-containing protein [Rhodoferax sp.]|uniref:DUF4123 domain-containing protein n=1 Tax=Rhodoferax sp. TaxID=50421 RepID=UPI003265039D